MNVIELHQAHAAPWGSPLLSDINLCLTPGSILGVIGPNGAGKSSLLQVLCGAVPLSSGTATLLGKPLARWPARARAQRLAMLPQQSLLSFPFTVQEVILLGRTPHQTGTQADQAIATDVMVATDTLSLQHRLYTQLSGGERQRVQLARVLAQIWHDDQHRGRLLLLDEPTSALDLQHQRLVLDVLKQLARQGCTIALVMHDFNLLGSIADQLLTLHRGQPVAQGTPREVLTKTMFHKVFNVDVTISHHPVSGQPLVVNM
jgi:iron complex transport system ATP-binding protein